MIGNVQKIHVLIIGAGHYSTGTTSLTGHKSTDKDLGVLLPSVLALQQEGLVGKVGLVATDGTRIAKVRRDWISRGGQHFPHADFESFPAEGVVDTEAYVDALKSMPRPCAALIAVPDHLHKSIMMACINEGIHFLVVKPAVTNLRDLYDVLDAIGQKRVFGMVDYHKVFDEANILLKTEYQQGCYGKIQHATTLMTQRRDMLDIYSRQLASNDATNINHYLGSHYIHMVGFITGAKVLDVRATAQFGVAEKILKRDGIADLIETQIRWQDKNGSMFTSYHVSGWSDPSETESMTYQELHLICEKGHVDSDQRYRGFRKVISGDGYSALNPYFFNLTKDPLGRIGLNTKYGFISIRTFLESCVGVIQGIVTLPELDEMLPTLKESASVTAVLEAADLSLANGSRVVVVRYEGDRYSLEMQK
ncbi:MAG: Gfo/Idh/MocA family protein [Gammaproteobacteria bacterium]